MSTTIESPADSASDLGVGLVEFAQGYESEAGVAPEYPLLYLPSAFMLSASLSQSITRTNAASLAKWCGENPAIKKKIYAEVLRVSRYSRHAIRVSLEKGRLKQTGMQFAPVTHGSKSAGRPPRSFSAAYRLGEWCGHINSTKTIYSILGLDR